MKVDKDFEEIYKEMDLECVDLCKAINSLEGIQTTESCCGHGTHPYMIFLVTEDIGYLPDLLYYIDVCHTGFSGWQMRVYTDCSKCYPVLMLTKEVSESTYEEAKIIAKLILEKPRRGKVKFRKEI